MDPICLHCLGVHEGHKFACPVCGRGLVLYIPTRQQIAVAAAVIRSGWSTNVEASRSCDDHATWEVPSVSRHSDKMVRRDADPWRG